MLSAHCEAESLTEFLAPITSIRLGLKKTIKQDGQSSE